MVGTLVRTGGTELTVHHGRLVPGPLAIVLGRDGEETFMIGTRGRSG